MNTCYININIHFEMFQVKRYKIKVDWLTYIYFKISLKDKLKFILGQFYHI